VELTKSLRYFGDVEWSRYQSRVTALVAIETEGLEANTVVVTPAWFDEWMQSKEFKDAAVKDRKLVQWATSMRSKGASLQRLRGAAVTLAEAYAADQADWRPGISVRFNWAPFPRELRQEVRRRLGQRVFRECSGAFVERAVGPAWT
jgi:hypothetical protein